MKAQKLLNNYFGAGLTGADCLYPLKTETHFISDLHLSLDKPEITRRFLHYLEKTAPKAQSLYILGDLFDAWIGDDDNTPPNKSIKQGLKQLSEQGTQIFMIRGNRDFLLGERFCQATGIHLLADFARIELDHQAILLTHGDLLCTDDVAYQAFREKSRQPEWQSNVLSKPLWLRLLAARWYRLRSHYHKRGKTQDIMDVNQLSLESVLRENNCLCLIHGHTHRPDQHSFLLDDKAAQRIVLSDWTKDRGAYLSWNGTQFSEHLI